MKTYIKREANPIADLIKQAVAIKEHRFYGLDVDPIDAMSSDVGLELCYLLKFQDEDKIYLDWGSYIYEWMSFIQSLLVLIGKPGVLDQIHEHYRPAAAERLEQLMMFFRIIDQGQTYQWLDYISIQHYGANLSEDYKKHLLKRYDFRNRETDENNFFSSDLIIEMKRVKEMEEAYKELQKQKS